MKNGNAHVKLGTKISIIKRDGDAVFVTTEDKDSGWIHRANLCSLAELKRRTRNGELPDWLAVLHKKSEIKANIRDLASGLIQSNQPIVESAIRFWVHDAQAIGNAFWVDKSFSENEAFCENKFHKTSLLSR